MTDYSYVDKLRNQKLKFIPKEGNIILGFSLSRKNNSEEWSHGLLPIDKATLKLSEKMAKAIPILVDKDQLERYFLPDECTVQFKEEIGETEIDKIIEYCQCSILIKHRTSNYYTVKINKNKDVFETIRNLSEFGEVEFAEPSEIDSDALSHPYYTDKLTGKQLLFIPRNDELVITYKADDTASSALPNFGILDLNDDTASVPDDADRCCPAMIDSDGLTRYFLPNEFTVQFREDINNEAAEKVLKNTGCSILSKQRTEGYYIVAVPDDRDFFATVRQLIELDEVEFAEPSEVCLDNFAYRPMSPMFGNLWGLNNTGQTVQGKTGTSGIDIKLTEAWDITMGDPNVIIVIIDTGVNLEHPNLAKNILPCNGEDWDFCPDGDEIPEDEHYRFHGTHVAGIAGAIESSEGIIGVAPKCKLMPLRVTLRDGRNTDRVDALNYVVDVAKQHPELRYVINCSWVMGGDNTAIYQAIKRAIDNNIVVIFAAGNDDWDMDVKPRYPAVYPEVIAVAGLDQKNQKVSSSNYGSQIDVCAPGENIWSTSGEGKYRFDTGTSMAAPHVAGVAALIWSVNPQLTNHQIRQILEDSCDEVDQANPDFSNKLGKGRINALKAINNTLMR
jgi:subtilisin family serine protease